eukprot:gene16290-17928_t
MANCEVLFVFRKPETVKFKITEGDLPSILGKGNVHFFLVAKGKGIHKETQVLLDMRSGTVFIQTDKPIYSPKEKVKYRVIPVGPDFLPMKQQVMVEIVNPQGIRVSRERNIEAWKRGFATKEFVLGDIPVHGTWTITAYFSNKNVANSSTTFLVKEYVLPTFLVRVMPPSYITETDKTISVKVTAKYSYGKNVLGNIWLRLSIIDDERKEFVIDDQRSMISGEEDFFISADKLIAPKEIPSFPIGSKLKIFATVTERATGTKESATDLSTVLVKSPYTISFTNTAKYFRPALSFRVQVSVRFPNKRPAKDIKLRFSATNSERPLAMGEISSNLANTNERGEAFFTLNTPKDIVDATRINVLVKTQMNTVENSEAKLTLEPYISAKKNYIVVRPPVFVPKIGSRTSIKVLIPFHGEINQLNYLVSARGRIVDQGTVQRNVGVETSFPLSITADMAPKCRIVVYFERQGEIAADSALMDIEDGFNNKIKIEPRIINDRETDLTAFRPALDIVLRVENQKQSLVGIVGVDQSVYYLRNKSRITHEKVFKDIGNFDLGCGVGSGKDNGDVFYTAGLFALSSTPLLTKKRNTLICPEYNPSRKRRSVANKPPALIGKCCKGRCCGAGLLRGRSIGGVIDRIPSPDEIDNDETQGTIRQSFPETWIWKDQLTGDADKTELRFTIPDTITTWEVSALSINNDNGFGLSNVLHLQSTRNVFIHVKMPYSAQRREQITVYAVVYNYYEVKARANIFLKGHSTFCSVAKPGERSSRISVVIDPKSAIAIPFVIIPLTIGTIPIEFQAFTRDNFGEQTSDHIIKELLVVPEGVPKESVHSITLDPQGRLESKNKKEENTKVKGRKGNQPYTYDLKIPEDFVKDSQLVTVYVTGNMMGAAVEDIIKGGLNNLVRLPTGCGEQTMIRMAPTVYVLRYLTSIKNGVTSEIEKKAYSFMRSGYNHELKWRRTDNSYSVWGQRTPASTWLTAFVNKVFCQAREFIKDDIDENIVCDSLKFLESIQEPDGSFPEGYAVRHRDMIIQQPGDTACETKALHTLHGGVESKLSLTAFVIISLMECSTACPRYDTVIISKARSFLESQMPQITSGYLMSLVAYSLSIANSPVKNAAYNKLAGMLIQDTSEDRDAMYIKDGGPALCVEATSYALLTMMSLKETDAAGPLVVWLTKQRNAKGSFYSTQIKVEPRKIDDRETDLTAFRPALNFVLRVENQKQSLVGIVGVDQSVYYLRNKSRITHEKLNLVSKEVRKQRVNGNVAPGNICEKLRMNYVNDNVFKDIGNFDLGCGVGSGKDNGDVFYTAGFFALSSTPLLTKKRNSKLVFLNRNLPEYNPSRKRRSVANKALRGRTIGGAIDLIPSPDEIDTDETQLTLRQSFPETWIWKDQLTGQIYSERPRVICSVAKPGKRSSRISVVIEPKSAIAIPFVIIPLTIGTIPIEFQAFTKDNFVDKTESDRVIKELLVVPEGVPKESVHSITLDPQGRLESKNKKEENTKGRKRNQLNTYDLKIPEDFVKDSQLVTVYVTGNMMGAAVEDIIKGGLNNLVRLPTGCGEQTMIRMAPTVYVLRYLTSIKNGVTSEIEKKAYSFMRSGYNHELKWRRTDNSYSVWGQRTPASTWLTAFVNKVFCQAREFIKDDIDENIVCDSLKFLESIQEPDGSFPEGYAVRHREMIVQQPGDTACETKALQTLHDTVIISKARSFLESQMPQITSGYLMSLVAYSLSIANSPVKNAAYNKLAGMLLQDTSEDRDAMYIKDGGPALCVEATSYALLTMMSLKETDAAGPLVVWLTKQRNAKGSFYSTQDTVVALQALSEYSSKTAGGELDLTVTVTSAKDADIVRSFRVKAENALVRQQTDITGALPGRVFIDTKGKGTAQLQIVTTYNQPSSKNERCGYVIKVKTNEGINNLVSDAPDGAKLKQLKKKKSKKCKKRKGKKSRRRMKCKKNKKTKRNQQKDQVANEITVDVCATHKFANGSSMTIVDVGLLTGFKPDQKSLKALLSKDQNPRIDHYEENDRGVVFYLGKISNTKKTCITFVTKRVFSVGDLLPVPVKVYDYYEPSDSCTVFYGPKANSQLLGTICDDDDKCQCSQATCADEPTTNVIVLKKKACLDADFVFTGVIKAIEDQNSWERVAVRVEKIHKEGKVDYSVGGKLHVYKTKACVYPELKVNKKYLIMLKDGIKYVIDKEAFILAWPDHSKKKQKLRNALSEVQQGDVCDKL